MSGMTGRPAMGRSRGAALRAAAILGLVAGLLTSPAPAAATNARATAGTTGSVRTEAGEPSVNLGKYAFNGKINAAVADPATGNTFLGGEFTQMGTRSGSVAVIAPPDLGIANLQAGPDVVGQIDQVIADGDGYFVGGKVVAVNGTATPGAKVVRIAADGSLDAWHAVNADSCADMVDSHVLGATSKWLIVGEVAGLSGNKTGLGFIDRTTGQAYYCGIWTSIPALPELTQCAGTSYCSGQAFRVEVDEANHILVALIATFIGSASYGVQWRWSLVAYDMQAGTRLWIRPLQVEPPANQRVVGGELASMAIAGGRILASGTFPLDSPVINDSTTTMMVLDEQTGSVLRRWSKLGEQALDSPNGTPIASAEVCASYDSGSANAGFTAVSSTEIVGFAPASWSGTGDPRDFPVCHYSVEAGSVHWGISGVYHRADDISPAMISTFSWPSELYTANGTDYLIGAHGAIRLRDGTTMAWDPEPGTANPATSVATAIVGGKIVLAGPFTFIHGAAAAGLAALGPDLEPVVGFQPPAILSTNGPQALALGSGKLIVGGELGVNETFTPAIALDAATGALSTWQPAATAPNPVEAIAIDPATGAFYLGGRSHAGSPKVALQRYRSIASGGTLDTAFAPQFDCLHAGSATRVAPTAHCSFGDPAQDTAEVLGLDLEGSTLYVSGAFGGVNGAARQGAARLSAAGVLDAWNPALVDAMGIPSGSYLYDFEPRRIRLTGDKVVVGGLFGYMTDQPGGGGAITTSSPMLAFDATAGARVRPIDTPARAWFPVGGWWVSTWDMTLVGPKLYVALGDEGVAVFDAATLDFDATASAPTLTTDFWERNSGSGVFALAQAFAPAPAQPAGAARAQASAQDLVRTLVIGGQIPTWHNRTAGNVVVENLGIVLPPPAAAKFIVAGFPATRTAGQIGSVRVTATDSSDGRITGYLGKVHFSSTDPKATLPADYTFTAADAGTHLFTVVLKTAGSQTITVTDTASAATGSQAGIAVSATTLSKLSVSGFPTPRTAGVAGTVQVTATDTYGNRISGYRGTVKFGSSDAKATLPPNYTFTEADAGSHTFTVTLATAGSQSIIAADTTTTTIRGSQTSISITPGTLAKLVPSGFPSTRTAGVGGSFRVTAVDALGNKVPSYRGTVHFTSSDPKASLPRDYTFTQTDSGAHSFSITLKTAGTHWITARDVATQSLAATQTGIVVSPAAVSKLVVSGFPTPQGAGTAGTIQVAATDAYGNRISGYRGTVKFGSSDAKATLPANYTFTEADAGAHAFSVTLTTAATQSITVADTVTTTIRGSQTGIVVTPGALVKLVVSGLTTPRKVGVAGSVRVAATDTFGNRITTYRGRIHFTSTDAKAALPADYTFTQSDAGTHVFTVTLKTIGTWSVTATDLATPALTGSQTGIVVQAAV